MQQTKISKFLSFVLRHKPEAIGLTLAANGWVNIGELIEGARKAGVHLSHDFICEVVKTSDKRRFAISQDGLRIRASQGHSILVNLALPESVPPEILYHGTTKRSLAVIHSEGIKPGRRIRVHLSLDKRDRRQSRQPPRPDGGVAGV